MFIILKILYIKRSCVDLIGNYNQIEGNKKKNNCSVFERRYKYHGIHKRGARMDKIEVRLRRMALVVSETLLP